MGALLMPVAPKMEGFLESGFVDLVRLGRRLKAARTDAGYRSTREVAAAVFRRYQVEISPNSLGRYERGEYVIPLDVLLALSFLYEQPLSYFLEPSLKGEARRDFDRLG